MIEFVTSHLARMGSFFTLDLIFLVFLFAITIFALVELALKVAGVQGSILFESLKTLKSLKKCGDTNFHTLRAKFVTFPERIRRAYNHYLDNMSLVPSRFLSPQLIHRELEKNVLFPNALKFLCFSLGLVFSLLAFSIESLTSLQALKSISFFLVAVTLFYFVFSAIKSSFDKLCEKSFLSMVKQLDFFSYLKMPSLYSLAVSKNTEFSSGVQNSLKNTSEKQSTLSSSQLALLISQSKSLENDVANDIEMGTSNQALTHTCDLEKFAWEQDFNAMTEKISDSPCAKEEEEDFLAKETAISHGVISQEKPVFQYRFSKNETSEKKPNQFKLLRREQEILSPQKETANLSSKSPDLEKAGENDAKLSSAFDQILKSEDKTSCDQVKELEKELSLQDAQLYAKAKEIFKLGDKTALSNFEETTKKLLGLEQTTTDCSPQSNEEPPIESLEKTNLQSCNKAEETEENHGVEKIKNFVETETLSIIQSEETFQPYGETKEELTQVESFEKTGEELLVQNALEQNGETTAPQPIEQIENASALQSFGETCEPPTQNTPEEMQAENADFKLEQAEEDLATTQPLENAEKELATTQPLENAEKELATTQPLGDTDSVDSWNEKTEEEIVEELIQSEIDTCKDDDEEIYAKTKEFLANENYKSWQSRNYFGQ